MSKNVDPNESSIRSNPWTNDENAVENPDVQNIELGFGLADPDRNDTENAADDTTDTTADTGDPEPEMHEHVVTTITTTKILSPVEMDKVKIPKVPTFETYKRRTIKDMKDLGVYKPQYNRLVDIYAGLLQQYARALGDFEMSGYQYETETAAGNPKKSSIVSTMESLRKDILQYSDRLMLNPKSDMSSDDKKDSGSGLAAVLASFDK